MRATFGGPAYLALRVNLGAFFVPKKGEKMLILWLILNALGLLALVIICGFIAIAVKSFVKELKK